MCCVQQCYCATAHTVAHWYDISSRWSRVSGAVQPWRLEVSPCRVYHREAMDASHEARADRKLLPKDYLVRGQKWISRDRHTTAVSRISREERISYPAGKLREHTPGAVYLLQDISMKLYLELDALEVERLKQGTDKKRWTLQKLANESGFSLRTINDLLHGKTWPKLETIATLEIFLGKPLWIHDYLKLVKNEEQPPTTRGRQPISRPSLSGLP